MFDIGGVLARIRGTWGECADAAGVEIDPSMREARSTSFEPFEPFQRGAMEPAAFLRLLVEYLGCASAAEARAVHDAMLAEPFPGMDEIGVRLRQAGVGTACLSNTNAPHWKLLNDPRLFSAIAGLDVKAVSHELGCAKPSEQVFEALERLTGASGADLLYFDDYPEYVEAARSRGWLAEVVDPDAGPANQVEAVLTAHGFLV